MTVFDLGFAYTSRPIACLDHGPLIQHKPRGITLHYTAESSLERTLASCTRSRLGYHFLIDRDGSVVQTVPCARSAWHAGNAAWKGQSPNRTHVAIAVCSWGAVELDEDAHVYESWNKDRLPEAEIEWRPSNLDQTLYPWHAATKAQEKSLLSLVRYLLETYQIDPDDVCDHSECAIPKGRKVDIGGSFSLTMRELRALLKKDQKSL